MIVVYPCIKNEYKEDIKNLIKEEQDKEAIINTKEFSNFLNNKVYYNFKF